MADSEFSEEQKLYLEGFASGSKLAEQIGARGAEGGGQSHTGPDAAHIAAQDQTVAAGRKLVAEEKAKRDEHPFDIYARMKEAARAGEFPKGVDVFRWKFHGLFHVAPAQDSFMCRLRIPNGILSHWQMRGIADLADAHGGRYSHVTTRANLQVREIGPEGGIPFIDGLVALGLTSRGSGADNIRNVTGSPTAGIDAAELYDTRTLCLEWHNHILNDRSLYGLPRKFNVAFDGGGAIPVLEDTNDIGFQAVRIGEGADVPPGIYFRLALGGITGHEDFARDTGILLTPDQCCAVADAIVRVFIENGDRSSRTKARLKYVLDAWGFDKFIAAVEEKLGRSLTRFALAGCSLPAARDRQAHVGVHPQKTPGLNYIGVVLPVGKMTTDQMRVLSDLARDFGDGDLRLTVWQNLLISGIGDADLEIVKSRLEECGLDWNATAIRAGLIACTGSVGCKFAASDTKGNAEEIARYCEERIHLDQPVNIHLTGCHHSCAQHYIGDIGLLGCRVSLDEESDDTVEGYHVYVGGGFGADAKIGRELRRDLPMTETPAFIAGLLRSYLENRSGAEETFQQFTNRHDTDSLLNIMETIA